MVQRASCGRLESIATPRFPEDPGSRFPPSGAALAADGWELRPSSGTALGRRHLGAAPSQQASSCSFNSDISGGHPLGLVQDSTAAPPSSTSPQQATCMQICLTTCLLGNPTFVTDLATPNPHLLCSTQLPLASATMLPRPGIYQAPVSCPVTPIQPERAATDLSMAPTPPGLSECRSFTAVLFTLAFSKKAFEVAQCVTE